MRYIWFFIAAALIGLPFTSRANNEGDLDTPPISPELTSYLQTIQAEVSALRGLTVQTPLYGQFLSRQQIRRQVEQNSRQGRNDPLLQFYRAFDFIVDGQLNLGQLITEMNGANVGGYYDLVEGEIFVVLDAGDTPGDKLTPREQIIYAHEFTHALQDQNFDIPDILWFNNTQETYTAALALIEGDAMFTQELFVWERAQQSIKNHNLLEITLFGETTPPSVDVPGIINAELEFIYLGGMNFVKYLYEQGGWELVNAAYENPPTSSEHIIYPERYLQADMPQNVRINRTSTAFDAFDDWERVSEDTLGVFYLREYLATQLNSVAVDEAITGWGGDRYLLYFNRSADQHAWIVNTVWDTPQDAELFAVHYADFASKRTGQNSPSIREDSVCWRADEMALCLHIAANYRVSISTAPTINEAHAMITLQTGR